MSHATREYWIRVGLPSDWLDGYPDSLVPELYPKAVHWFASYLGLPAHVAQIRRLRAAYLKRGDGEQHFLYWLLQSLHTAASVSSAPFLTRTKQETASSIEDARRATRVIQRFMEEYGTDQTLGQLLLSSKGLNHFKAAIDAGFADLHLSELLESWVSQNAPRGWKSNSYSPRPESGSIEARLFCVSLIQDFRSDLGRPFYEVIASLCNTALPDLAEDIDAEKVKDIGRRMRKVV